MGLKQQLTFDNFDYIQLHLHRLGSVLYLGLVNDKNQSIEFDRQE